MPAVTENITVVKAFLDIHKYKKDAEGDKLTEEEKAGNGRTIHVQSTDNTRQRAKLVVTCLPEAYAGTLKIKPIMANVELFKAATGTDKPSTDEIATGPSKTPATFYVQGKTASTAKADTGFTLEVVDLAPKADTVKMTVVSTSLTIHADAATPSGDPPALSAERKADPGRILLKQDAKFKRQRAKLQLVKLPKDAPCILQLVAESPKVKVFPAAARVRSDTETAETLPKKIQAGEVTDNAGVTFWVEGSALSSFQETKLKIDIDDVDEGCDVVPLTVVDLTNHDGSEVAPHLVPIENELTKISHANEVKVKLDHGLGSGTYAWSSSCAKITLSDQTTETAKLTGKADPSTTSRAEVLKLTFTPSGKTAFDLEHKFSVVSVTFAEEPTHPGGYDKYEVIAEKKQDGSNDTHTPADKYDFVSIEKSTTGTVKLEFKGAEKEEVFFTSKAEDIAKPKVESPASGSPTTLEIDAQAKDKDETILEARLGSKTGPVANQIGVAVLKVVDYEAELFCVEDSTSVGTTLVDKCTGAEATDHLKKGYRGGITTLTISGGSSTTDIAYDTNSNGALDLSPGTTSPEELLVNAGCVSTKARVVIVKKLRWAYFLGSDAAATDTTFTVTAPSWAVRYIGVGNRYRVEDSAGGCTIRVSAVNTSTGLVTANAPLGVALTTARKAALVWPLGGLSGDPAWIQGGQGTSVLKDVIGHELGHQLAGFKDVCEVANLMYGVNSRTDTRLRHRPLNALYPGGPVEKQWTLMRGR